MSCPGCRIQVRFLARQKTRISPNSVSLTTFVPRTRSVPTSLRLLSSTATIRQDQQPPPSQSLKTPPALPKDFIARIAARHGGAYTRIRLASALYEACGQAGEYTISEELRQKDEVPKTEDGSEIGTAEGPWVKGAFIRFPWAMQSRQP
jgi:hypothetical protein